jgi:hypothetical protein
MRADSSPSFSMRWSVEEWKSTETSLNVPVVLVGDSRSIYSVLGALLNEKHAIGIDVVAGPNESMPVICLCCGGAVFAIESSLVQREDITILCTFLSGLKTPTVSVRDNIFDSSFGGTLVPCVRKVERRRAAPPDPRNISESAEALALHFGSSCFHARQSFMESKTHVSPDHIQAAETYKRLALVQPVKRQRTGPAMPAPAPPPRRSEEPAPLPLFTEDPVCEAPDTELNMENAKKYMQWFQ